MAINKNSIDLVSKAKRVSLLRSITGYSRREFCEKTKIAERTLQFWEKGEGKGITHEGAKILLRACEKLGIYANYEWVMHGFGSPPFLDEQKQNLYYSRSADNRLSHLDLEESKIIMKELEVFREHYSNAVDLTVEDDSMLPFFKKGDFVAGQAYYDQQIKGAVDHDCIVLTKDAKKMLRYVMPGSVQDYYTLTSHHLKSNAQNLIVQDVELVSAAPVLWIRKSLKGLDEQGNLH